MRVVALVPAKDAAPSVGLTVAALRTLEGVHDVLVIDDGSTDTTADAARAAGARVLRLPANVGKGAAVRAGRDATPDADVYLLVDADVASTAAAVGRLLAPVVAGDADLAVGVLPPAGGRGGLGLVRRLAAAGIRRATGTEPAAPLSGQRAVRGPLLRALEPAARFGLETAMSIDARRAGARIVEVDVAMEHRHTGRSLAGFRHRARQGADVVRALWPRLTTPGQRVAVILAAFVAVVAAALWSGGRWEAPSVPLGAGGAAARPLDKVVMFGVPKLGWDDVGTGAMPHLDALVARGAVAAVTVRTASGRPSTTEGYATLGAASRVKADDLGGYAFDAGTPLEGTTAGDALHRRTGVAPSGDVVVVGAPATIRLNDRRHLSSLPGALGDALHRAGLRTGVVGNADIGYRPAKRSSLLRPAASAVMGAKGSIDAGAVSPALLARDPAAPFGLRADPAAVRAAVAAALADADVVLVDPGDMDRAAEFAAVATPAAAAVARRRAVRATDRLLGDVARMAGPRSLLLVVSVAPPGRDWHLTPLVAAGPGVRHGQLHSPSTRRLGVVTLTDVAPTVLDALGAPAGPGMIGHPLRQHPGPVDLDRFRRVDRDAAFREWAYFGLTETFIAVQALVYLLAVAAFARLGGVGRAGTGLRWLVLAVSAWPLATFVLRAIPDAAALEAGAVVLLVVLDVAIVALALRARRHALSPLAWICGATVAVFVADVATGANLQLSSLLGYSLHTAARFTGFGNTAFAALAATTIIAVALHVHAAPRPREALVTAGCVFAVAILADGAPSLGSDVGGILTLVPVFGLTLAVMSGRRLSWRTLGVAAALTVAVVGLATALDLLRPPETRTHLGRLAVEVRERGWSPLTTTLARKAAGNLRTFGSPWTWTVPIVAVYMAYVLAWERGWSALLPPGSAVRAGVVGVLAVGLLGYAVNDSGVVVTAVVFVFIGPLLTLLALERERGSPVLLEPRAPGRPLTDPMVAGA